MTMYGWIVQNAAVSGVLAAAVAAVCRLGRFSPAVKHALWLIVLLKLMAPPLVRYPVPRALDKSLRWLISARSSQGMVDSPTLDASLPPIDVAETAEILPRFVIEYESDFAPTAPDFVQQQASAIEPDRAGVDRSRLTGWLLTGWLVGAVVSAGIQATGFVRLCRFLRQSAAAPNWLDGLVHQAARRLRVRPPEVAVIPALCSPMVCSLGRPRLLWPARLGDHLGPEALEAVLLHELAHLRRRDHWVAWLEVVAGVIWWFDPVYWYARHQIHENAELACDAWVIAMLPAGRRTYAHALVEVTEFVSSAPAALPAVAMGNIARSSLERRLTMIMRESFSYRVPLIGSGVIGLALLAVLPGWTRGQQIEDAAVQPLPAREPAVQSGPAAGTIPTDTAEVAKGDADIAVPKTDSTSPKTDSASAAQPNDPSAGITDPFAGIGMPAASNQQGGVDQKIHDIEAKLAQLLAEIQQLRGSGSAAQQMRPMVKAGSQQAGSQQADPFGANPYRDAALADPLGSAAQQMRQMMKAGSQQASSQQVGSQQVGSQQSDPFGANLYRMDTRKPGAMRGQRAGAAGQATDDVETLTRARYKLPQAVADAARAFIEEYFHRDISAKVEGDVLTVIASTEDQQRISMFVELLRDSGRDNGDGARQVR